MNPATLEEAISLAKASDQENIVIAPPFVFIEEVAKVLKKARLGAQDVFWENPPAGGGAFTGEVSAQELKNLCVEYVIVGHSERRHKLGETDEIVAKKLKAATDTGLVPILCIGETEEEKNAGKREAVLERQLKTALSDLQLTTNNLQPFVAYEPVWAIGTGNPETPESALATIKFIKELLKNFRISDFGFRVSVLYGGSVNSQNLQDYIKYKEVDGALVGGASLQEEEIKKIIKLI